MVRGERDRTQRDMKVTLLLSTGGLDESARHDQARFRGALGRSACSPFFGQDSWVRRRGLFDSFFAASGGLPPI